MHGHVLEDATMAAHVLAMVRSEDDERVLGEAEAVKSVQQPADLLIEVAHEAVVVGHELAVLAARPGGPVEQVPHLAGEDKLALEALVLGREVDVGHAPVEVLVGLWGRGHRVVDGLREREAVGVVHAVPRLRRVHRPVGALVADAEAEGILIPCVLLQVRDGIVSEEGLDEVLLGDHGVPVADDGMVPAPDFLPGERLLEAELTEVGHVVGIG